MNTNMMDLSHMSDSDRYWFCYLNRQAEDKGWSKKTDKPKGMSRYLSPLKGDISREDYLLFYLFDSLMVGLHTTDPILSLRCYAQAQNYTGLLNGLEVQTYSSVGDALRILRSRVENSYKKVLGV